MNPILAIVLGILFIVMNVIVYRKTFQLSRELRGAKVADEEGNERELTEEEIGQLAYCENLKPGKHFWKLLAFGVFLISTILITLRVLGYIPNK